MYSRVESNDHLNIVLEIVVFPNKSFEVRIVAGPEEDEHHIDPFLRFYFSENVEYEIPGRVTVALLVPGKIQSVCAG